MLSTVQLLLALGFGRFAVVADLVLTGAVGVLTAVLVTRARRGQAEMTARTEADVVARAEAVVRQAGDRQRA